MITIITTITTETFAVECWMPFNFCNNQQEVRNDEILKKMLNHAAWKAANISYHLPLRKRGLFTLGFVTLSLLK